MKTPKVGMKVKYSHAWLKSVQAEKDVADMEGEIIHVKELPTKGKFYCRVLWNTKEVYGILASNLVEIKDGNLVDHTE